MTYPGLHPNIKRIFEVDRVSGVDGDAISSLTCPISGEVISATGSARPVLRVNAVNGVHQAAEFDGTDDKLVGATAGLAGLTEWSMIAVIQPLAFAASWENAISMGSADGSTLHGICLSDAWPNAISTISHDGDNDANPGHGWEIGTWAIVSTGSRRASLGGGGFLRVNSQDSTRQPANYYESPPAASAMGATLTSAPYLTLGHYSTGPQYAQFRFACAYIYNAMLSPAQAFEREVWLASKYRIVPGSGPRPYTT